MSTYFSIRQPAKTRQLSTAHPSNDRWCRLLTNQNKAVSNYRWYFRQSASQPPEDFVHDAVRRLENMNHIIDAMSAEGIVVPYVQLQADAMRINAQGRLMVSEFVLYTTLARLQRDIVTTLVELTDHMHWESAKGRQIAKTLRVVESDSYQKIIHAIRQRYLWQ